MELLFKILLNMTFNVSALLLTTYFIPNFIVISDVPHLIPLVAILTFMNLTIRPVLRIIFRPVIGITLGLFNIIISGGILYVIDIWSNSLTINGLWALIVGAHVVGFIVTLIDYSSAAVYGSSEI